MLTVSDFQTSVGGISVKKIFYRHYRLGKNMHKLITSKGRGTTQTPIDKCIRRISQKSFGKRGVSVSNFGGYTICLAELSDGTYAAGAANCSTGDNFCYAVGRDLASKRITKVLNEIGIYLSK